MNNSFTEAIVKPEAEDDNEKDDLPDSWECHDDDNDGDKDDDDDDEVHSNKTDDKVSVKYFFLFI